MLFLPLQFPDLHFRYCYGADEPGSSVRSAPILAGFSSDCDLRNIQTQQATEVGYSFFISEISFSFYEKPETV